MGRGSERPLFSGVNASVGVEGCLGRWEGLGGTEVQTEGASVALPLEDHSVQPASLLWASLCWTGGGGPGSASCLDLGTPSRPLAAKGGRSWRERRLPGSSHRMCTVACVLVPTWEWWP